jgi:hypothetical protein
MNCFRDKEKACNKDCPLFITSKELGEDIIPAGCSFKVSALVIDHFVKIYDDILSLPMVAAEI